MVLLSKTPLRISFFGGGTDYPEYYMRRSGSVLGMSINKYIYIALIEMCGIQDYKYRISYSVLELAKSIDSINHPVIRAILKDFSIESSLDISIMSDMPANSGLGSSSSFTVGLVNLLKAFQNVGATKLDIALDAIRTERDLLHENVGIQDQLHASFGGLNKFEFNSSSISVTPVVMTSKNLNTLNNSLFLVYTGKQRHASHVVKKQVISTASGELDSALESLQFLLLDAEKLLRMSTTNDLLFDFGALLMEGWIIKKSLSTCISNSDIDDLASLCILNGATGLKLCGAGSGGFILCVVAECRQDTFIKQMEPFRAIKVCMDLEGTTIVAK